MTRPVYAFDRLFSRAHWFRTKAWRVAVWCGCSCLLLVVQIIGLVYLFALFETRGLYDLDQAEARIISGSPGFAAPAQVAGENPDVPRSPVWISSGIHEDTGILPFAISNHDNLFGRFTMGLYRRIPWLRTNNEALLFLLLAITLIGILRLFLIMQARLLAGHVSMNLINGTRRALHRQALRLGPGELRDHSREHVSQLFTVELDSVRQNLSTWIFRICCHPLLILTWLAVAICINWRLTLQCLVPLGCCWYLVHREQERWQRSRKMTESRAASQARLLSEGLNKTRLIRAFAMEHFEQEQFQKLLQRFQETILRVTPGELLSYWTSYAVAFLGVTLVMFLIGMKVLLPVDNPQHLMLASTLILGIAFFSMRHPLEELFGLPGIRKQISISVDKVHRYIDQIPEVGQAVGARFLEPLTRQLQYENVTCKLPGTETIVLDRVDLRIPARSLTAIISIDPIEARAFAYLLPRFIEPQSGRILFDGEDIAWGTLESLRAETVYIGEEDRFFTGTVTQNITCGNPEYTLNKAMEAAKLVHAHHFITRLPQGYETMLGEHGESLDHGQAFRLTLARAALRNPALLVMEEPKGTLDDDTKAHIDDAYSRLFPGRTVIILPTRLSTLKKADRVILIYKGRVESIGTHNDLIQKSPLYRHWEYTQFNTFRQNQNGQPTS